MALVQFEAAVDHYAVGDVVKLSAAEQKRVDEYAEINNIKSPYKTVTKAQAKDLAGSGTVEPKAGEVTDHNGERVQNDPAPQTPVAGDGADVKVTAADRKAAKEAAKRGQAPAQQ